MSNMTTGASPDNAEDETPTALPRPSGSRNRASRPVTATDTLRRMNGGSGTTAVSWGPDQIDLFWVGRDGALMHRIREGGIWLAAAPRFPSVEPPDRPVPHSLRQVAS